VGFFHKALIPLTGKRRVIFRVVPAEQFQAAPVQPEQPLPLSNHVPEKNAEFDWARQPKATITCEGSSEPAEQAEPLEAQIPSKSNLMHGRWIAPNLAEERQHRPAHRRVKWRRGVVIEENRPGHQIHSAENGGNTTS
jgi:hypothetical protein